MLVDMYVFENCSATDCLRTLDSGDWYYQTLIFKSVHKDFV